MHTEDAADVGRTVGFGGVANAAVSVAAKDEGDSLVAVAVAAETGNAIGAGEDVPAAEPGLRAPGHWFG